MSAWREVWALLREHPRERLKLLLGWIFHRRSTAAWLAYLRVRPVLWRQVAVFPKLVTRIYRPYGLRGLRCEQRVQLMTGHYDSLERLGYWQLVEVSADRPCEVLTLPTKCGTHALLQLVSVHDGHREGEMHLQMFWDGRWLYSLSFLLQPFGQRTDLVVTRLGVRFIQPSVHRPNHNKNT